MPSLVDAGCDAVVLVAFNGPCVDRSQGGEGVGGRAVFGEEDFDQLLESRTGPSPRLRSHSARDSRPCEVIV
jgi:hypothetical protein